MEREVPIAFAYYAVGDEYKRMMEHSAESLRRHLPNADIRIIDDQRLPATIGDFKAKYQTHFPGGIRFGVASMFRLGIPLMEQFADCKRVVWLDADTEVMSSEIGRLATINLKGKELGAGLDIVSNRYARPEILANVLGTQKHKTYFNTGVIVFDLERIAKDIWETRLNQMLDGFVSHADKLRYADQDVLNAYCDICEIPSRFDCLAKWHFAPRRYCIAVRDPVVLHYAGQSRKYYSKEK